MGKSFRDRIERGNLGVGPEGIPALRRYEKAKDRKEDFRCSNCHEMVPGVASGSGHRNHCPSCLFSKHVDISPGIRAAAITCGARMEPGEIRVEKNDVQIRHHCLGCGHDKWNRIVPDDNAELLLRLPHPSLSDEEIRAAIWGKRPEG